jgi:hypothetical protein
LNNNPFLSLSRQRERAGVRVDMISDGFPLTFILSPVGRGYYKEVYCNMKYF